MSNQPVIIVGAPRSGTSICAGLVALSGIYTGPTIPGNSNNARGFYESAEIRNRIVKPFLSSIGADPMGQDPLPDVEEERMHLGLRGEVEDILGVTKGERWMLKEPKILLMWKSWHHAFSHAKWVVVRRDSEDILRSVVRTNFMRAFEGREEWRPWLRYHLDRMTAVMNNTDAIEFWPGKVLNGDFSHLYQLAAHLQLDIPLTKAIEFLDPKLWSGQ